MEEGVTVLKINGKPRGRGKTCRTEAQYRPGVLSGVTKEAKGEAKKDFVGFFFARAASDHGSYHFGLISSREAIEQRTKAAERRGCRSEERAGRGAPVRSPAT